MSEIVSEYKLGWIPDLPDFRDYTIENDQVSPKLLQLNVQDSVSKMVDKLNISDIDKLSIPTSVDLRSWCSPIEDQQNIGSCTAHAGVGIVEYFERRAFGKYIDASRLFLYKVTRNLLQWTGDTGAYLRTTMGALALFGLPPEKYYPYITQNFDNEPSAFCYSFAESYKSIQYFRLDSSSLNRTLLLKRIKSFISAGVPSMFGFSVYESIWDADAGKIPFPSNTEKVIGGHAISAVGYNDFMVIENPRSKEKTVGALLIRNSWGTKWGEGGYGWLPYDYILKSLATDCWVLLKNDWIDTGNFGI